MSYLCIFIHVHTWQKWFVLPVGRPYTDPRAILADVNDLLKPFAVMRKDLVRHASGRILTLLLMPRPGLSSLPILSAPLTTVSSPFER